MLQKGKEPVEMEPQEHMGERRASDGPGRAWALGRGMIWSSLRFNRIVLAASPTIE